MFGTKELNSYISIVKRNRFWVIKRAMSSLLTRCTQTRNDIVKTSAANPSIN